jgi:hypothetical protein
VPSTPAQNAEVLAAAPPAIDLADTVALAGDTPAISVASDTPPAIRAVDFTMMWLGAALIVPWFGWRFVDGYLVRKKTTTIVMRHFAERFVREFERPLVLDDARRPLRTRVRYNARRGRLDILLAPGAGRRYPNLTDHKKNVEYDVERIVHALGDESFVSGALFTQAGWVVVPFRFFVRRSRGKGGKAEQQQSGVSCISSL